MPSGRSTLWQPRTAPKLEADAIILRPVCLADAPAMQAHFSNWNVIKWIGDVPWPYPEDGAQSYIQRRLNEARSREIYFWGIFLKSHPAELIGTIEYRFFENDDENRGFWLAEDHWGKGIMTRAVILTQDYVFFELGKPRLLMRSLATNLASKAIKERTGARVIGQSYGSYHDGTQLEDVWDVTVVSWQAARAKLGQ